MKKAFHFIPVAAFAFIISCNIDNLSNTDDEDDMNGDTNGDSNAAFAVTGFSVVENAVVDDLKPSIVVTFNKTVDAASVTAASVTLDSGGAPVSLVLSVSGATVTAVPQLHLENTKACTLTVGTAVKDAAAASLAAAAVLHFTVSDPNNAVYVSAAGNASNSGLSPDHPVDTIAAGLAAAAADNLGAVWVAGGTYPITETISLIGGISLLGGYSADFSSRDFAANETIVTSGSLGSLVSVSDAALTNADVLEGFTLKNIDFPTTGSHAIAVSCSGTAASPVIRNNRLVVSRTTANTARAYGFFRTDAPAVDTSLVLSNNTMLVSNTVTSGGIGGGGIYIQGISAASEVVIEGNVIAMDGAGETMGICCNPDNGKVIIRNNFIQSESTGMNYAIGMNDGTAAKTIIVANNTIMCSSSSSSNYGIWILSNNPACTITIVNNIIGSSTGTGYAFNRADTDPVLTYSNNTAFRFSAAATGYTPDGSNLYSAGDLSGTLFAAGTFDTDLTDGLDADYHLIEAASTYALNLGLDANTAAYGNVTVDIDGDARPAGSCDRGADEKL